MRADEAAHFHYWLIMMQLLKIGIPWDVIQNCSESEVYTILAMQNAIVQKENEEQQAQMPNTSSLGHF